jgi:hypothetical protein
VGTDVRITLDWGNEGEQEWLEAHLAARGLGLGEYLSVAGYGIARRKGRRLYAYGRGSGGSPVVVVLMRTSIGWRPRTAWRMDDVELRWWRGQGGR